MKKDIEIPIVKNVYVAVVKQWNTEYELYDWNAFIINDNDQQIDAVMVVSQGYSTEKKTSKFRHMLGTVAPKSATKIEFIQDKVISFTNEFSVTYFLDNKLFDKKFVFRKNTINEKALQAIPNMTDKGVLVK
ncbi:hypothetical protein [Aquimarina agarivorans]|uniref:hypothetical protein n=1 Tax=Aquimarina agarivorans TaxID=980584 RepID=UPI000248EB5E|nr:hypothetical protein [Aquimarina agarivorans]